MTVLPLSGSGRASRRCWTWTLSRNGSPGPAATGPTPQPARGPAEVEHAEPFPPGRPPRAADAAGPRSAAVGTGLARDLAGALHLGRFRGRRVVRPAARIAGSCAYRDPCLVCR